MPDEPPGITDSYDVWPDQIWGYLQAMNGRLTEHQAQLDRIERHMRALLASFASGGLRGFRAAAREMANDGR